MSSDSKTTAPTATTPTGGTTGATTTGAPVSDAAATNTTPGRIERRPIHQGRIVDLSIDTVRFPDGSTGQLEMIRHSGASAILPVLGGPGDPDPEVILLRQYRYAADGYLLEVPAGRPDFPGEDWEDCARRELEEETGLVAGRLVPLTTIYTTPGFTDERIHLFLAFNLTTGRTKLDTDEFIETIRLPLSEALASVRNGEIVDAKTICTLYTAVDRLREIAKTEID